jgi:hypothetical protein
MTVKVGIPCWRRSCCLSSNKVTSESRSIRLLAWCSCEPVPKTTRSLPCQV